MKKTVVLALLMTLAAPFAGMDDVRAEGFALTQWGARGQSLANGMIGRADDPSAVAYNPAGITQLPGTQMMLGSVVEQPHSRIVGEAHIAHDLPLPGYPANIAENIDKREWIIPHAYLTHQLNDKFWFGFGAFGRFGLGNGYADKWGGSAALVDVHLQNLTLNPNIAYKVTDRLSVAVGLELSFGTMELNVHPRVPDLDGMKGLMETNPALGAQLAPYVPLMNHLSGLSNLSNHGKLTGDGYALSGNFALHYILNDQWRFGFAYRSRMDLHVTGKAEWAHQFGAPMLNSKLHGVIHLPDHFALGVNYRPNDKWNFEAGLTYFTWSTYKDLNIKLEAPNNQLLTDGTKHWKDNWGFNISAEYKPVDWLALRAGYCIENSPLNEEYTDFIAPTNGRQYFTTGVGFMGDKWTVDLAYVYIVVRDAHYNQMPLMSAAGHDLATFTGKSDRSFAHSLGASVSYRF